MSTTQPVDSMLRKALNANGIFSLLMAIDCLLFAPFVAELLGEVSPLIIRILGVGLLLFGVDLLLLARKNTINLKVARAITWMDWSWVAASLIILLLANQYFSTNGFFIVCLTSLVVAVCAHYQRIGIERLELQPAN